MPRHIVVDGSNLATEGRSMPSLQQLNDAVNAFIAENPTDVITVVVDATFGHRIDQSEVPEFEEAIEHNELVAPPAGAVGRGDAFVLSIANKVNATILTNDSYQEFHPDYPWLFDEGRLIGGKPVPHVGWVFVARTPVRGPVSRRATREKKAKQAGIPTKAAKASKAANQPMPVPTAPPPGATLRGARSGASETAAAESTGRGRRRGGRGGGGAAAAEAATATATVAAPAAAAAATASSAGAHVNPLMPFLTFVEKHPVGTSVNAIVESYSSHGAYVALGDVRGYVPLRLMADPAPRSAREQMKLGESVTLVVVSYAPSRRSIDLSVPHLAGIGVATGESSSDTPPSTPAPRSGRRSKASPATEAATEAAATAPAATAKASGRASAKKAGAAPAESAPKASARTKAAAGAATATPVKKSAAKKAAETAPAPKKAAPTKAAAQASAATKPTQTAPPAKKAPAKAPAATKAAATKAPAAKKAAAKKAAAKAPAAPKAPAAKKAAAKKPPAAKAPATKAPAAKKAAATKAAR